MKKIVMFALATILLTGCGTAAYSPTSTSTGSPPNQNTQVYKNGTYGFEFSYPSDMVFVTPSYANLEDKIVEVQIPQTEYPKTNFGDAAFSVSASFSKTLAGCLKFDSENGSKFGTSTVPINGVNFYLATGGGAGAGNLYESKVYRTLVGNQTCVELNETLHTSNIDNYPTGTVTEIDKTRVWDKLDVVLNSFHFSK